MQKAAEMSFRIFRFCNLWNFGRSTLVFLTKFSKIEKYRLSRGFSKKILDFLCWVLENTLIPDFESWMRATQLFWRSLIFQLTCKGGGINVCIICIVTLFLAEYCGFGWVVGTFFWIFWFCFRNRLKMLYCHFLKVRI